MRALAILVEDGQFDTRAAAALPTARSETRPGVQDATFEKLFLADSYVASLRALSVVANPHDVARVSIVAWYYSVYFASQAMLSIAGQDVPEEHRKTARIWLTQLVRGPAVSWVPYPFDLSVSSLVKKTADEECARLRRGSGHQLRDLPRTLDEAHDAHVAYLSGCVAYYRSQEEDKVRRSREYRDAGFADFRKKPARELRDRALDRCSLGFMEMAFRYRGKANYRDAIFLCYGDVAANMKEFLSDLLTVALAYNRMTRRWIAARVSDDVWIAFEADLKAHSKLTAAPQQQHAADGAARRR
jgi:hypothetical protein